MKEIKERVIGYTRKNRPDRIEYHLTWSNYFLATKFDVLKKLTEMTGIYVVFYLNKYKRLTPLMLGAAWYSGLRPMALKIYTKVSTDNIPAYIYSKVETEKIYIKYIEIYVLEDMLNIFFKLREQYKDAFIDTNGLECPSNLDRVKIVEENTKFYHKTYPHPDI
ncbi:MAG TPA: hypothetical protein PLE45_04935 [Spirochaetota bacterium]|nr:hypothetical protein [Spirochaetota bacterium]HOL56804.1 hypothetical protein [Spirochaetota bacterium]HPP03873.1 hypothetical protein [Spirochaetota bacterium]